MNCLVTIEDRKPDLFLRWFQAKGGAPLVKPVSTFTSEFITKQRPDRIYIGAERAYISYLEFYIEICLNALIGGSRSKLTAIRKCQAGCRRENKIQTKLHHCGIPVDGDTGNVGKTAAVDDRQCAANRRAGVV